MDQTQRKRPSRPTAPLQRRVTAFLAVHGLQQGPRPLLVGVSGGPDSVCLLHALSTLRAPTSPTLIAVHINHQLRGADSAADAAYVRDLCARLGIDLVTRAVDVRSHMKERKLSLEEAARGLRHGAFSDAAAASNAQAVLLGHTANDQAETVLLHILRGSGVAGLSGMAPVSTMGTQPRPLTIARPLLTTTRRETEAYCAEHALAPRIDTTNLLPAFTRNRIRHELLPQLSTFNPKVRDALIRLAGSAGEALTFLDQEVQKVWTKIVQQEPAGLAVSRNMLLGLAPALAAHLSRRAVLEVRGSLEGITAAHLDALLRLARGPGGKATRLPGGLNCTVDSDYLRLDLAAPALPAPLGSTLLKVPGVTLAGAWEVQASLLLRANILPVPPPFQADLDSALAGRPLWVTSRQRGDRFQPLGMAGTKKVQDLLVDAKVPRSRRDAVPIVRGEAGVLWVVGHRIAEAARVPNEARTVLRLGFYPSRTPAPSSEAKG